MAIDRDKVLEAAQALVDKKRYDKAIVEYQKVLKADPKDGRVLLKIAEAQLKAEQFEPAISTLEQVAQLHAVQGFALKAVAAYQQARDVVQRYLPHLTERYGYLVPRMAELYVQLRRGNDAIALYEETAARFEAAGRQRDAADVLKKVVELDPQSPERAARFGEALLRLGDVDGALPHLTTWAKALAGRGQHTDAINVAERVLAAKQDPDLARLAAQLYLDRGEPKDGAAAFMKIQICYKIAPKDLDTLGLLARALHVLRQPDRAVEVHKEAARVAHEIGREDALDHHMETLMARAANDPVVRKLATHWRKAPAWLLEAPPEPRLPQAPSRVAVPMGPQAAPNPGLASLAPIAPPMPPQHGAPIPMGPPPQYGAPIPMGPAGGPPTPPPYAAPIPMGPSGGPPTPPPRGAPIPMGPSGGPPTPPPRGAPIPMGPSGGPPTPPPRGAPPLPPRLTPAAPQQRAAAPPPRVPPPRGAPPPPPPRAAPPQRAAAPPIEIETYGFDPQQPIAPPIATPAPPIATPAPPIEIEGYDFSKPIAPPAEPERAPAPPIEIEGYDLDAQPIDPPTTSDDQPAPPPVTMPPVEPVEAAPPSFSGRGRFDEEALEEVDFFVSQAMYEDAIALLDEQLERLPGHPLLLDRRSEIEEMARAAAGEPVDS